MLQKKYWLALCLLVGLALLPACRSSSASAGPGEGAGVERAIQNKGSDTLVNLALAWAERYRQIEPGISIAVTGGGSGTGIAALINGTVDIASSSRPISHEEEAEAQARDAEPFELVVAIDALAIVVHPDNPVDNLTIHQLADIYTGRITNWQEVGGADASIVLLSRETNSGTHVYFLETVIREGKADNKDIFAPQTLLMPSSVGITNEIRRNVNAIGYDGLGYVTEEEKVVAVGAEAGQPYILPSVESAAEGLYPLSRPLFMYTNGQPTGAIADYLDWVLGPEGQAIVAELGFVPLPEE
jgi:phosphate transport system substrate-binding protein